MSPQQFFRWFTTFQPRPNAKLRLVCIPFAGGGAGAFRTWVARLPESVEMLTVQLPGRESRVREAPLRSVSEVVDRIAPLLLEQRPIPTAIFGHSLGAIIGFELGRALERHAPGLLHHLCVSGRGAPQVPVPSQKYLMDDEAFRRELESYGATPRCILQDRALMDAFLPGIRADFQMNETYRYVDGPPLSCPLTVLAAFHDTLIPNHWIPAWEQNSSVSCHFHWFDGGHFFVRERHLEVLGTLLRALGVDAPPAAQPVYAPNQR